MAGGGHVILRSKPFIASELGSCGDPPRGLKFTRPRGRSNELRGFKPTCPGNSALHTINIMLWYTDTTRNLDAFAPCNNCVTIHFVECTTKPPTTKPPTTKPPLRGCFRCFLTAKCHNQLFCASKPTGKELQHYKCMNLC